MTLQFGVNPFDKCPNQKERFHVIDPDGYIVAKTRLGITAYDHAGNLSDRLPGKFTVKDTRDNSDYAVLENGYEV